jgi:hypothetical protein
MLTKDDVDQLRGVVKEEVQASEERLTTKIRDEIRASEERLTKKMESELEETIEVLKEFIHTGYNMHEERIKQLEDQAEQPHKN